MPDATHRQLPALLCALLLVPALVWAEAGNSYRVEMLIFSRPGGGSAEVWEPTPTLAYPGQARFLVDAELPATTAPEQDPGAAPGTTEGAAADPGSTPAFTTLPASELEFQGAAARMQRDGRYRKLFHAAWVQPLPSSSQAVPLVLDRSGDGGNWPALQGSVKLYAAGDIYLETNLWLNTNGEYLRSDWRMPPPPLGPPTISPVDEFTPASLPPASGPEAQSEQGQDNSGLPGDQTTGESPGYPYAHAVLLHQTRRLRSGQLSYIDHPFLGLVVKVTPMTGATGSNPATTP